MGERDVAICILGAMMGAGFASGREIMQFFSRWGDLSWGLILLVAVAMAGLCCRVMKRGRRGMTGLLPGGRGWGAAIPALLMTATAGSMTAASGELAALMVPIHHARTLGMAGSLAVSLWMARRPLNVMAWLSRLMLPGMIGVFILCMALPGGEEAAVPLSFLDCAGAVISVLGYAGMNVMLAAGVLCQAGGQRQSPAQRARRKQKRSFPKGAAPLSAFPPCVWRREA